MSEGRSLDADHQDDAELSRGWRTAAQPPIPDTRHNPVVGIMTELVADGPVKVYRLKKGRGRRHLDEIGARDTEGAVAADAQVGAGRADQRLGLRQDEIVV